MIRLTREQFGGLVRQAYQALPTPLRQRLDNLEIEVAAWPSHEDLAMAGVKGRRSLLGLYTGVPLTLRGGDRPALPDRIIIFQRPIELCCFTEPEVVEQVRVTLLHEIGHYMGMDEAQLHRLGYG